MPVPELSVLAGVIRSRARDRPHQPGGKNVLIFINQWFRYGDRSKTPAWVPMSVSGLRPASGPARGQTRGRRAALVTAALLGAMAAGCGEQRLTDAELSFATRSIAVDPSRAIIMLPPGGPPIVNVTQRNYENAVSQTITLATRGRTPGENAIHAAFLTAADVPDTNGVEGRLLSLPSIEDFAIAREMEERLPGVAMVPSAAYVQNRYGPFGYAYGRGAGGDGCLYAWQQVASGDSLFRPRSGVISVRLRVCAPGASEAALLRLAYGFSVNASLRRPGWNPIGDAPSPSPDLGEAGAPIYPLPQTSVPQTSLPDALERPPRVARPKRPQPARAEVRDPVPDRSLPDRPLPDRPLEGYPTVPPPLSP